MVSDSVVDILHDHLQDHPQDQEIEDYAKFLGMDPNSSVDRELMYIAKQGLMEPVPAPWEA